MTVTLFGVRHHGPGSARSVARALVELAPDIVLIEGPPDADGILALAGRDEMRPPVALLVYAPSEPHRSASYPLAVFSPEWQAIRYALAHEVPVRFIDLPATNQLALARDAAPEIDTETDVDVDSEADTGVDGDPPDGTVESVGLRYDPLRWLADAAGYGDPEQWWEDVVEHRDHSPFEQIAVAMTALREHAPPAVDSRFEQRREAHMRSCIRSALKEGFGSIAVICGAWHVPALATMPTATADAAVLKGLPRLAVVATWIPWTYGRLSFSSGYGAGVNSPGWYHEVFTTAADKLIPRWLTETARLLRDEDLDASSASVIEAVRLTEALAAVRARPRPGLDEALDATRAVLCGGSEVPLALVKKRLVVGERLGEVPPDTPAVPLQEDLTRAQRRLKLKPEATPRIIDLDLRKPLDLDRSRLLHRLALLGLSWGVAAREQVSSRGTFHEFWELLWRPELSLAVIEASRWGNTIEIAATALVADRVGTAATPAVLTDLIEACLDADLPAAVGDLVGALAARAAVDRDIEHLMDALPALARILRYGNVRGAEAAVLDPILRGMVTHISIGLGLACSSLDNDSAVEMLTRVDNTSAAVGLLADADISESWTQALVRLADQAGLQARVAGRVCRLLLDGATFDHAEAARRLGLALSRGTVAEDTAGWVEGFVSGSGLLLVHDPTLLGLLDEWLGSHTEDDFVAILPLLRRTFATFAVGERRMVGERVRSFSAEGGVGPTPVDPAPGGFDTDRAAAVLPLVSVLLGLTDGLTDGLIGGLIGGPSDEEVTP